MPSRGLKSSFQMAYRLIRLSKQVTATKKATAWAVAFVSVLLYFQCSELSGLIWQDSARLREMVPEMRLAVTARPMTITLRCSRRPEPSD
jgi:hypothetical protein